MVPPEDTEEVNGGSILGTLLILALVLVVGGVGIAGGLIALKKMRDYNEEYQKNLDLGEGKVPKGYKAALGIGPTISDHSPKKRENDYQRPGQYGDHERTDR